MSAISGLQQFICHDVPKAVGSYLSTIHVIAIEIFTTLFYIIPNMIKWCFKKYIQREITEYPLQINGMKAYLFLHGKIEASTSPLLLVHGDYSHPSTLLHIADMAGKHTTFSLFLPSAHNNTLLEENSALIQEAMNKMKQLIGGEVKNILGVGHSKGATLLAKHQFLHPNSPIDHLFSIAGRLNSKEPNSHIRRIYERILNPGKKRVVQLAPKYDWVIPPEGLQIPGYISIPDTHLGSLFSNSIEPNFKSFLSKSL